MNTVLHTFQDGSTLRLTSAKELLKIPIWKGNRILDLGHVVEIQKAIGSKVHTLDSGYHIVQYEELDATQVPVLQSYIIDGQHRAAVLRNHYESTLCEPDFPVVITVRRVVDEEGAISYFNAINKCKPQAWKSDPVLLANKYVAALIHHFNRGKKNLLIRPGATHRPYLSSDRLREVLSIYPDRLKQRREDVEAFVLRVKDWNAQEVGAQSMALALNAVHKKDATILQKSVDCEFMCAFDGAFKWIPACLDG